MKDRPMVEFSCESFREQLERLPLEPPGSKAGDWREILPQEAREHAAKCATCDAALGDFVETRQALGGMRSALPEPGPWFVSRVMAAIRAQEKEVREQAEGVWISVMRLAPRLSAFAAVLLVLGGTWVMELRRAEHVRQQQMRPAEGMFETAPSAPPNDDIIASTYEESQP